MHFSECVTNTHALTHAQFVAFSSFSEERYRFFFIVFFFSLRFWQHKFQSANVHYDFKFIIYDFLESLFKKTEKQKESQACELTQPHIYKTKRKSTRVFLTNNFVFNTFSNVTQKSRAYIWRLNKRLKKRHCVCVFVFFFLCMKFAHARV